MGASGPVRLLFSEEDLAVILPPPPLVQVQMGASGPVRLLFSEDLAVVEFWDTLAKR